MVSFYYQPQIKKISTKLPTIIIFSESILVVTLNIIFYISVVYGASYLPYGKFFNRLGGNIASLFSFSYILIYLALPFGILTSKLDGYFFKKIIKSFKH